MNSVDIYGLMRKLQDGTIAPGEIGKLLETANEEFAILKKEDPKKYVSVLRELNVLVMELNRAIDLLNARKMKDF